MSTVIALTVAAVPTGMKAGVSTVPKAVVRRPRRAAPSRRQQVEADHGVRSAVEQAGVAIAEEAKALGDGVGVGAP